MQHLLLNECRRGQEYVILKNIIFLSPAVFRHFVIYLNNISSGITFCLG